MQTVKVSNNLHIAHNVVIDGTPRPFRYANTQGQLMGLVFTLLELSIIIRGHVIVRKASSLCQLGI